MKPTSLLPSLPLALLLALVLTPVVAMAGRVYTPSVVKKNAAPKTAQNAEKQPPASTDGEASAGGGIETLTLPTPHEHHPGDCACPPEHPLENRAFVAWENRSFTADADALARESREYGANLGPLAGLPTRQAALDHYTEALRKRQAAGERNPGDLFCRRGVVYALEGQWEKARADFTQALANPESADANALAAALFYRALVAERTGKPKEALADYTRIIQQTGPLARRDVGPSPQWQARALNNRALLHWRAGRRKAQIADLSQAIALPGVPPGQLAMALVNRAYALWWPENREPFVADLTRAAALSDAPAEWRARALMERALLNEGPYADDTAHAKAAADYAQAATIPGLSADLQSEALCLQAATFYKRGDFWRRNPNYTPQSGERPSARQLDAWWREAKACYDQALRLPGLSVDGRVRVRIGPAKLLEGGKQEAALREVAATPGASAEWQARALLELGRGIGANRKEADRWQAALPPYTQALELPGVSPETRRTLLRARAHAHEKAGQWAQVAEDYTALLALLKEDKEAYFSTLFQRAEAYDKAGQPEKQVADLTEILDHKGDMDGADWGNTLFQRAKANAAAGRTKEALADYTAFIDPAASPFVKAHPGFRKTLCDENKAEALLQRGLLYRDTGERGKAVADLTRATREDLADGSPRYHISLRAWFARVPLHDSAEAKLRDCLRLVAALEGSSHHDGPPQYHRAAKESPMLEEARRQRDALYAQLPEPRRPLADYARGLENEP